MWSRLRSMIAGLAVFAGLILAASGSLAGTLTIPSSVKTIEEEAFYGDKSISEVELPDGILRIESKAFANSSINSLNLPASLTFIAEDAFDQTEIRAVNAEKGTYAYQWAVLHGLVINQTDAEEWEYTVGEDGVYVTSYNGDDSCVLVPSDLEGKPVVSVQINPEKPRNYGITKVVLPAQPIAIGEEAFMNLPNLSEIDGLEYVTSVGELAFFDSAVRKLVFSGNLYHLDSQVFIGSIIQEITIPSDLQYEDSAFAAYYMKKINLIKGAGAPTITLIDGVLFSADKKTLLYYPAKKAGASYAIPDGTVRIAPEAFVTGDPLAEIIFPDSVTDIAENAIQATEPTELLVNRESAAYTYASQLASRASRIRCVMINRDEETLQQFVARIVREKASSGSTYEKALALHDWLIDYAEYDFRESGVAITSGAGMLREGRGVCAAYASAYQMLLTEAGIECKPAGNAIHAFVAVKVGSDWMYVDCTWDDVNSDEKTNHTYFGFEDTIRYAVYGADDPDTLDDIIIDPSTLSVKQYKNHYWYKKGYCTAAIKTAKSNVKEQLDAGEKTFSVSCPEENIIGMLTAAAIADADWTVSGADMKIACSWSDGVLLCALLGDNDPSLEDYEYDILNNQIRILKYTGSSSNVTIPSSINGLLVAYIGPAFLGNTTVTTVKLPDTIVEIEGNAFRGAALLKKINFPDHLSVIGDSAFSFCTNLSSDVVLPSGFTSIGMVAFNHCSSIKSVSLPSTTLLSDMSFLDCSGITELTLAEGITSIPSSAFSGCISLKAVTLPKSLINLGNNAFYSTSITKVTIPENVSYIGEAPFQECNSLTSLTVDSNNPYYKSADNIVFSKDGKTILFSTIYAGKANYTIPDGVTTLCERAFCGNQVIKNLTIPGSVTEIPTELFTGQFSENKTALESLTVQNGVKTLGNECFSGCSHLTKVSLPDSVTSIGYCVFSGTAIEELRIPKKITTIPAHFFSPDTKKLYIHENVTTAEPSDYSFYPTVIYGKSGTFAETFAKTYDLSFAATD